MSEIDFYKNNDCFRKNSENYSFNQKLKDKEKITSQILGFLSKFTRTNTLERIKLELGLQEDTSGDRYESGYHT